ncbi:MAG: GTPase HflX [Planctomycetota bacterium]
MEQGQRENNVAVALERAVLVAALLPNDGLDPHDPLGELRSLADTAGAVVVDELMQKRTKPDAATFIGKGKVRELAEMVKFHNAEVVLFENDLSPSQIAKVEEQVECKVLDRSELILDIFAARARTAEARLQVELAQLQYTYPRLRAMWTHLDTVTGGAPVGIGTRGPGEQQLEIDRRIVQRKKAQLQREIAEVQSRKTREVEARNVDHFTVGLVGYTNAGKSTLFNTVTEGGAYADDKLFATLSTRTRVWKLGDGDEVMLSDTVGFVRNLPHHLVASFKATLEEAVHADLLLIVLDAADPNAKRMLETVYDVLDDIGAKDNERLLVLNKADKLEDNAELLLLTREHPDAIALSAKTGVGIDQLVERVRTASRGRTRTLDFTVPHADGKTLNFLENRAVILNRDYGPDHVILKARIGDRQLAMLKSQGTKAKWPGKHDASGNGWGNNNT